MKLTIHIALIWGTIFALVGGWVANIVKIYNYSGDLLTPEFIIRCVGVVVAPLGSVMGYL